MRYMLICCIDEADWRAAGEATRDAVMREYHAWVGRLERDGKHVASGQLGPVATAVTLRDVDGKTVAVDGPFAETKEQVGGYHVLECADRDEAIGLARGIPTFRVGGAIEVRPFVE